MKKIKCLVLFLFIILLSSGPLLAESAKDHFSAGEKYLKEKDYSKSIDEFMKTLKLDKSYKDRCYYNIALCYENKGDYNTAIDYYKKAADVIKRKDKLAECYYKLGNCSLNIENYDKAIEAFLNAVKTDPSYSKICYYNTGLCYESKNDYNKAIEYYHKALKYTDKKDEMADYYFAIGYCYLRAGKYNEGKQPLLNASKYDPFYNYSSFYNVGLCYEGLEQYDKAIKFYEKSVLNTDDKEQLADAYYSIAYCYNITGKTDKALEYYIKSNSCSPSANTYYNMGLIYEQTGKKEEAIKSYQEYLNLEPEGRHSAYCKKFIGNADDDISSGNSFKDLMDNGKKYYKNGRYDNAVECFNKALSLEPSSAEAHLYIAYAYHDQGLLEDALKEYKKVITLDDKSFYAPYYMGEIYMDLYDYKNAITYYTMARELTDKDSLKGDVDFYTGNCYLNSGSYKEAITCYEKALVEIPEEPVTHYNLGQCYYNSGDFQKAKEYYKKYIEVSPNGDYVEKAKSRIGEIESGSVNSSTILAKNHYKQAWKYCDEKNYDKAKEEFLKAIELNENYVEAYNDLGYLYLTFDKNYDKAEEYFLATLKIKPDYGLGKYNLGIVYMYKGDNKKAVENFKQYLELEPSGKYSEASKGYIKELEKE